VENSNHSAPSRPGKPCRGEFTRPEPSRLGK